MTGHSFPVDFITSRSHWQAEAAFGQISVAVGGDHIHPLVGGDVGKHRIVTRTEISWILYDVANSAFIMLVSTTIPIYFATLVAEAGMDTTTASGS